MRYISPFANFTIYKNGGALAHNFGADGVCVVGSLTTATGAGNYIDASANPGDTDEEIQLLFAADLDGNNTNRLERAGLGSLDKSTQESGAGSLTNISDGFRYFFEAPVLTGTTDSVVAVSGVYYKVLSGTVTYNGTSYTKGQEFMANGSETATTGSGTFALTIPPALKNECEAFRDELFKVRHLQKGDESTSFYDFEDGYTPRSSLTCTDDNFFGWTR